MNNRLEKNATGTETSGEIESARRDLKRSILQVLELAPIPMALTTMEVGRFIDVNDAFARAVGRHRDDLVGRNAADLGILTRQDLSDFLRAACESGRVDSMTLDLRPRGGTARRVTCSATIFEGRDQPCLVWMLDAHPDAPRRDHSDIVTRERRTSTPAQADFDSASPRLEAIGRLSGAIAHSFNDLLSPIIGLSEMGLLESEPGSALHHDFEQIREAATQANELNRQLLAFGRKQRLKMRELNVNSIIEKTEQLIRRLTREDIEISINLQPSLGKVFGDAAQLQQILINLVLNARDAMPHGGEMVVETANTVINEEQIRTEKSISPGRYVMLSVSDTGYGMDDATQSRIFEPFFTTKGQGQGMGLATAYGIVKQHSGVIWVYSEPGEGTTLKVCIPRCDGTETDSSLAPTPMPSTGPHGSETILVVEDEDIVRRMVVRILKTHGYEVLNAAGGEEALELARTYEDPIHLLLTDVIMPQMNGKELRDAMRELRPDTKALYMSGYADVVIARHGVLEDEAGFLQKPFSLWDLTKKVREALDS